MKNKIFSVLLSILLSIPALATDKQMKDHIELLTQLKKDEGFRALPYKDQTGHWTWLYGHNLQGRSFTKEEHEHLFGDELRYPPTLSQLIRYIRKNAGTRVDGNYILEQDIKITEQTAKKIYGDHWSKVLKEKKVPLLDAIFNLGGPTYRKFKRHIAAVKALDWQKAADEILDSVAAEQAPVRYRLIAQELRK